MTAHADALYQIYLKDLPTIGHSGSNPCPCDFHMGRWDRFTGMTTSSARKPSTILPSGGGCYKTHGFSEKDMSDTDGKLARIERYRAVARTGYNCVRCNFKNDYAVANHGPDHYLCFNCR